MKNIVLQNMVRSIVGMYFWVIFCSFSFQNANAQSPTNQNSIKTTINIADCKKKGLLTTEGVKTISLIDNEIHCYDIILEKNEYARFLVQQEGIDVFLQLFNEKGFPITEEINSPNGESENEPVSLASTEKSKFVLAIATTDKQTRTPNYSIRVDEFRKAKESDFKYVAAEPLMLKGILLKQQENSDPVKAAELFEQAWTLLADQKDLSPSQLKLALQLLNNLGAIYQKDIIDLEKAKFYFGLMRDFSHQKDIVAEAFAHFNLGNTHNQAGDYETALTEYEQTEQLLPESFTETRLELLRRKGYIYWFRRIDFVRAEQIYRQIAQTYIDKLSDFDRAADTYVFIGAYYFDSGLVRKAKEFYQKAIDLEGVKNPAVKAYAHQNLAVLLSSEGNTQKALDEFDSAEKFYAESQKLSPESDNSEGIAYTLHGRAQVYLKLNDLSKALEYTRKALSFSLSDGKVKYPDAAAFEHLYLGVIDYKSGRKVEANKEYKTAIALWDQILNSPDCRQDSRECKVAFRGKAYALTNIGDLFYEGGEREKALNYFENARLIQTKINVLYGQTYALLNIGKIEFDLSNFGKAEDLFGQALETSRKTLDKYGEVATLYNLARVADKTDKPESAAKNLELAKEINENLRAATESEELRSSYFSTTNQLYELYVNVLMKLDKKYPNQGYVEKALEISDSSKARSLFDTLSAAKIDIRQNINPALLTRERQLQDQLALLIAQKRLALDLSNENMVRQQNLDKDITLALENLQKLIIEIQRSNPEFTELANSRPLKISEIQKALPPDTLLVEFSVGESNSYVWTVSTNEKVRGFSLAVGRKKLEELVRRLIENIKYQEPLKLLDDRKYQEYKEISRALSDILFQSVAGSLNKQHLIIVADESLQYVPFNGLPTVNKSEWQPLIVRYEINLVPSMGAFVALQNLTKQRLKAANLLAGFIDPEYEPRDDNCDEIEKPGNVALSSEFSLKNLGFGKILLGNLQDIVNQSRQKAATVFFKCREVSRQNAMSKDIENYRYILYYAHGKADDSDPASSGIYLSRYDQNNKLKNDYFLGMNDIYNLRLSADMVFLSACETALGKEIKGEGLVGITRGFMYAGSASVISSLWKVKENRTRILVERFFNKVLVEGQTVNLSLRQVQKDMWEKEKLPPYYWAAFQFQGIPTVNAPEPKFITK